MQINNMEFHFSYIGSAISALLVSGAGAYTAKLVTKNGMHFVNFLRQGTFSEKTIKSTANQVEKAAAVITGLSAFIFLKSREDVKDFTYIEGLSQADSSLQDQTWETFGGYVILQVMRAIIGENEDTQREKTKAEQARQNL